MHSFSFANKFQAFSESLSTWRVTPSTRSSEGSVPHPGLLRVGNPGGSASANVVWRTAPRAESGGAERLLGSDTEQAQWQGYLRVTRKLHAWGVVVGSLTAPRQRRSACRLNGSASPRASVCAPIRSSIPPKILTSRRGLFCHWSISLGGEYSKRAS